MLPLLAGVHASAKVKMVWLEGASSYKNNTFSFHVFFHVLCYFQHFPGGGGGEVNLLEGDLGRPSCLVMHSVNRPYLYIVSQ